MYYVAMAQVTHCDAIQLARSTLQLEWELLQSQCRYC